METIKINTTIENLPNEMYYEVFQYIVTLADFCNCRLVCQKWKGLLSNGYHNRYAMVYPLTSTTLYSAGDLTEDPATLDIYSLSGKEHQSAWSSSGIEQLLEYVQHLQFSGCKIEDDDVRKMLSRAKETVISICFKCTGKNLLRPFIGMSEKFQALRRVKIGYYCLTGENDNFNSFTTMLEGWSSDDCKAELPSLQSLELSFDGRAPGTGMIINVHSEELFAHYLAVGKVLLKYRRTLRKVLVERFCKNGFPAVPRTQYPPQWNERRRCLEDLGELHLNSLRICITDNSRWLLPSEFEGKGGATNLKELLFEMMMCPLNNVQMMTGILSSFASVQNIYLTSVAIGLVIMENNNPIPAIDLGAFRTCRSLKELRLMIVPGRQPGSILFRNLESLPKGISSFHVKANEDLGHNVAKQALLSRQQVGWVIRNLRVLESFSGCLAFEDGEEGKGGAGPEWINAMTNVDLPMFGQLISLPKLKMAEVDIIRGKCLAVVIRQNWAAAQTIPYTEISDLEQYTGLCETQGFRTKIRPTSNLGFSAYGYAKVEIRRN